MFHILVHGTVVVMIEVRHLTKRRGGRAVVDDLSFTLEPGTVTGFLGPNGAGKSSTMRMIVGLDRPSSGTVTIDGESYADAAAPIRLVGAMLDASAVHPARTAAAHLGTLAMTHGIGRRRVDEVLALTGLTRAAKQRIGTFSLGMTQRLGIATALLGDPRVVVLDEPVNGLDPEGVVWVRRLCRSLAAEGRTVLLSSHNMSETAQTADRLIVIGDGRKVADGTTAELLAGGQPGASLEDVFFALTAAHTRYRSDVA
jgi:ABC-2 type transport system ATP-binding protein